ncbi:helix-turn-helix domain-containing protein [Actinocorallia libanotica]|uniref:Helix-turn-helix domain-containing protein n=1 Tax=Actinocorallia libanotica TaxID=46162 RepID=A0ABN1Q2M2_9ACTN
MSVIERLWSVEDVARYLGVPVSTLYQWRHKGVGPKGRRVGKHVRYDPAAVRAWFESQE